jgi:hypothetical protein
LTRPSAAPLLAAKTSLRSLDDDGTLSARVKGIIAANARRVTPCRKSARGAWPATNHAGNIPSGQAGCGLQVGVDRPARRSLVCAAFCLGPAVELPLGPRAALDRRRAGRRGGGHMTVSCHEGQELDQIVALAPPEQPSGAPQGPRLRHQQDKQTFQGAPGLKAAPSSPRRHGTGPLTPRSGVTILWP